MTDKEKVLKVHPGAYAKKWGIYGYTIFSCKSFSDKEPISDCKNEIELAWSNAAQRLKGKEK